MLHKLKIIMDNKEVAIISSNNPLLNAYHLNHIIVIFLLLPNCVSRVTDQSDSSPVVTQQQQEYQNNDAFSRWGSFVSTTEANNTTTQQTTTTNTASEEGWPMAPPVEQQQQPQPQEEEWSFSEQVASSYSEPPIQSELHLFL